MHYYAKNIGDYRRDTMHLSPLEHGVYNLFMDTYYLSEKPLCADHAELMRTHCLRSADEVSAASNILKDFFILTDLGYQHKRCDVEIEAFHSKSKSASESAKSRWERVRCERIANALRTESEGNANHEPLTNNQEPLKSNTLGYSDAGKPACPHDKIIALYHQHLPMMPAVKVWTEKRKKSLQARWRESEKRQNLDYWERLFLHVAESDFLCGRTEKPFTCNLEWLINPANFVKVLEGNYANK